MKLKNFSIYRQGNFILAAIFIHFVFFGYLSNLYRKEIGYKLLFLYQLIFDPISFIAYVLLFIIIFIMAFRENFFEYGIRNSLWLIPLVIIESWIWVWFLYGTNFLNILILYFGTINGYLSILSLFITHIIAGILGSYVKERYKMYLKKIKSIE
ncbi:MAG: hypothetical protein EU541_06000 [Promethearchaeota archaeon]|nr:MAG: hypothetical protein EU541_06000 [Candidatus Lokiarchaeota archaeon]